MVRKLWLILVLLLSFLIGFKYLSKPNLPITSYDLDKLPGLETNFAPWLPEITQLQARLSIIGLPALTTEGTASHTHQHLDLFIDGQKMEVPAGIGIGPSDSYISSIHTHDTTGFIHVESPVVKDYFLGQFFDVWGVKFNDQCIGGYCSLGGKKLRLYSNGQEITGNFRGSKLTAHQEIVIVYGTDAQLPQPIPASFVFPADY